MNKLLGNDTIQAKAKSLNNEPIEFKPQIKMGLNL